MSIDNISHRNRPDVSGNFIGIVVSLLLHGLVLALMMYHWVPSSENREVTRPKFIEAKLLQMKPALEEPQQPKPEEKPRPQPQEDTAAKQRQEQARQEQARQEAEKQRQEAERQKEIARQKELEHRQQLQKEAERKRQQEVERQKEQERQKELARQEELKRQQEAKRQEDLLAAMAREEAALEAQQSEAQVGTYVDYMASLVASNWSRPPSATRNMEVLLHISLGSAGRVVGVQVAKSSGNAAFDRSAEQAVWKVGQFSRLEEMDPALYQREFRKMHLLFRPEDLRM